MTHRPDDPFGSDDEGRLDDDDLFGRRDRRQRPRVVSEFVRRAIDAVGNVSTGSGTVGRDAVEYLLKQGDRGRRELFRIVANEVGDFLRNADLSKEVVRVLTSVQVEFNATLKFKPTEEGRSVDPSESEARVSVSGTERSEPPRPSVRPSEPPPRTPVPGGEDEL